MIDGEGGNADDSNQQWGNQANDERDERLASLRLLQDDRVFHVGAIPRSAIAYWVDAVTDAVVIAGKQRNQHYLVRHPEIYDDEALLLQALVEPEEVHSNKLDVRIAIVYKQIDQEHYFRVALWISNRPARPNSALSVRRAGVAEINIGRSNGQLRWEK